MKTNSTIEPTMGRILDYWYDEAMKDALSKPDVIVYLKTTPAIAYARMQARGRTAELSVSLQYIQELHDLHENWISAWTGEE
ncbi:hypothetical protein HA402_006566 [Bradysia odoriphaga]|nr:hypothetical protein HA402_006566 [Bradysia odoriphaga]